MCIQSYLAHDEKTNPLPLEPFSFWGQKWEKISLLSTFWIFFKTSCQKIWVRGRICIFYAVWEISKNIKKERKGQWKLDSILSSSVLGNECMDFYPLWRRILFVARCWMGHLCMTLFRVFYVVNGEIHDQDQGEIADSRHTYKAKRPPPHPSKGEIFFAFHSSSFVISILYFFLNGSLLVRFGQYELQRSISLSCYCIAVDAW